MSLISSTLLRSPSSARVGGTSVRALSHLVASSSSNSTPSTSTTAIHSRSIHASTSTSNAYPGHIPINRFQRSLLAVGSAVTSLLDPYRHDMVAVLGETTSDRQLPRLREALLTQCGEEGLAILRDRPRLSSETIDLEKLRTMPEGSLGRAYIDWLEACKVTPDTREPVRYIDDPELAYIMQRYRECHDFYHVLLGFPVSVSAELVVKWFEMANMGLPVAVLSSVFGPLRLSSARRRRLSSTYLSWALRTGSSSQSLIGIYWEKRWSQNIDELRRELGITPPPMTWSEFRASAPKKAN
ncbi:Coq4-domain-containing protein [Cystobasidium minutum MCA 4210]|uniref:Coq4-domain-containing protein n=1 Tax=Cystobasidium minutum MCA 4210 TaxID=1397322 RepID=UPI0034CD18FD|eukprot:jgi/Rhomi1/162418/estExt_Genewise1Plus.C_5_t20490